MARIKGWELIALLLITVFISSCKTPLLHGLTEKEANEIIVLLQQEGIRALKTPDEGGKRGEKLWKIEVSEKDAPRAWSILTEHNLPREKQKGFADVFQKSGLIPTATEEKAMLIQALQGEISKTLVTIDGVVDARVHIVIPEVSEFEELEGKKPKVTASVLLKYFRTENGKPFKDSDIQKLVANAVEGLEPENVTVVSIPIANLESSKVKKEELYRFGPLVMTKSSKKPFKIILAILVVVFLVPWGIAAYLGTKLISLKKEQQAET